VSTRRRDCCLHSNGDVDRWHCSVTPAQRPDVPEPGTRARCTSVTSGHRSKDRRTFPKGEKDRRHIVTVTDCFTTWPQFYTINEESLTTSDDLVTGFTCRLGVPRGPHGHQGRNVKPRPMHEMPGVKHQGTYRPSSLSDGKAKLRHQTAEGRFWKTVSCIRSVGTRSYPSCCCHIQNQPAGTVLVAGPRLPCDLLFGAPTDDQSETGCVSDLLDRLHDIHR
jgi:hypothetical protein